MVIIFHRIMEMPQNFQCDEIINVHLFSIPAVVCPSGVNPNPDSSIVPIAVGCALAGLIVIVLIAYLVGRRKGGSRGYGKV